jgi:hypothetical protein
LNSDEFEIDQRWAEAEVCRKIYTEELVFSILPKSFPESQLNRVKEHTISGKRKCDWIQYIFFKNHEFTVLFSCHDFAHRWRSRTFSLFLSFFGEFRH